SCMPSRFRQDMMDRENFLRENPPPSGDAFPSRKQGQMAESKVRRVELFDTSLRDGLQQPNLEISVPNAVMLLQRMGVFGVRYAEIGFAGANQFVSDLTAAVAGVETGAMKLALFGRTRRRGTKVEAWPDLQ